MKCRFGAVAFAAVVLAFSLWMSQPASAHSATPSVACYTVRSGDYLVRVASILGTTWKNLAAVNHIANPNLIFPGQRICTAPQGATGSVAVPVGGGAVHAIYHNAHFANLGYPGYCVYYAQQVRSDLNLSGVGGAKNITWVAASRGYHTGTVPAVGALVVYQPGVQGANSTYGHVAVVTKVNPNGTFYAASMASPTPWVVATHLSWVQWGVSFVYG